MNHHFAEPLWFGLILFVIAVIFWKERFRLSVPNLSALKMLPHGRTTWLGFAGRWLRFLALSCLVLAMARPQSGNSEVKNHREGLDIVLVLDTSGSMKALDFSYKGKRRDRLFVIKQVITEFIGKRLDDRIGTVVFGTEAFPQAPMTLDHDVLMQFVDAIEIGMAGEATSIGDALAVATNRFKDVTSKSKVMILLTDGANTSGRIDPREAAQAAAKKGVKIYTIGVGSSGLVPIPTPMGIQQAKLELDEPLMRDIASTTQGQYFRASDTETLVKVYDTIDQLEKTKVEVKLYDHFDEDFGVWVLAALFFLLCELGLGLTRFERMP